MRDRYPNIPLLDTRRNFYIADDYPEYKGLVRGLSDEPGFFESLLPMANIIEGWERIIDLGYNPRICSKPIRTNPNSEVEKRRWLQRELAPHFGSAVVDEAIISSNKLQSEGIALVDDSPELPPTGTTGQHIVYDRPYNLDLVRPRLHGWLDENLGALLEAALEEASKTRPVVM